jgi:hypothetical protein
MPRTPETYPSLCLPFTQEGILQKIVNTPINIMVWNLLEYPHDFTSSGTGYEKLQNRLSTDLSEEDLGRIFAGEGPTNPIEQELKLLIELRGALYSITQHFYEALPEDYRNRLYENAVINGREEAKQQFDATRNEVVSEVYKTVEGTVRPSEKLGTISASLYEKANALMQFYGQKQFIRQTDNGYAGNGDNELDALRAGVVMDFVYIFSPDTPVEAIAHSYTYTFRTKPKAETTGWELVPSSDPDAWPEWKQNAPDENNA